MLARTAASALLATVITQTLAIPSLCPNIAAPLHPYQLAPGWSVVKVADGLHSPRDLQFDTQGRLLIVEEGVGIRQHTVDSATGCVTASRMLISDTALNHGIHLSLVGTTLFASSAASVFRWAYDPITGNAGTDPIEVVHGMAVTGHVTRTLAIPPQAPDLLVVSHGSSENLDYNSTNSAMARAIVKVFNMSTVPETAAGYDYASEGWNAGFGLRNEVGLAFDGNNMLWGVENSADGLTRTVNGISEDVHNDNPAEELNLLGDVTKPNDAWYGYPWCFTVWRPDEITDRPFSIGEQFVLAPDERFNDTICQRLSVAPRLSIQAHSAPLGSKFDARYMNLFVALHGSWDRQPPTGFKVVAIPFTRSPQGSYEPVKGPSSDSGYINVFYPPDVSQCSSDTCARPVGLAFDAVGRLYITSDASGEVFQLTAA
ncbi:Uu.00g056010.m01.CDS01 [Anthostomella pinea]|uniref:Uu.00g056010.m01.CDS01 n=1 Tax=Anthostomella pinea TaxID=933095 RepID=A0AAI8VWX9_9PEZI|nr:Uu.00g056010.m01.CDS01 [Anthostomella pinea]